MKEIKNYIVLVDYKKPYKHNTAGRYRVGAKTEKEAEELVRKKIGFGSAEVYYECGENDLPRLKYKTVLKDVPGGFEEPLHATAPRPKIRI